MDENSDNTSDNNTSSGFEAAFFASSPFLRGLRLFVRGRSGSDAASLRSKVVTCEKPSALTSLSPEVLARIRLVDDAVTDASRMQAAAGAERGHSFVGEGGRIDWSRVRVPLDCDDRGDGEEEALAEGARMAVACHAALRRQTFDRYQPWRRQNPSPTRLPREEMSQSPSEPGARALSFSGAMPGVFERIVRPETDDEQVYLALCVCLIILERALYDIYRIARAGIGLRGTTESVEKNPCANGDAGGGDGDGHVSVAAPVMILRDLIATPEIKAALPEQMVAVLRLLLLPQGFNVRNLVWHGFLAPRELPRELASLVLMVTLCIPAGPASHQGDMASVERVVGDREQQQSSPPLPRAQHQPLQTDGSQRAPWWALDSFDGRLAVPPALILAVESLLSERHRGELDALVRRSAFVLPGREDMAILALSALGGGRDGREPEEGREGAAAAATAAAAALFLVAMLPVLEHGLRCLFSCANDSPGHLFAHLRQYYSTLDGFGQKARHQLLLDQEIRGRPGQLNLLLDALGPGLSAVLLDLFMMSAGPNLRGKVAHGEMDISRVFSCSTTPSPEIVKLTAAVFLVLCRSARHGRGSEPGREGVSSSPSLAGAFTDALDACERHCSGWVPRFHPHELLEADFRASRDEFGSLALALERRVVSVELLPGGDLARMSVAVSGDDTDVGGYGESRVMTAEEIEAQPRAIVSPPGTQMLQGNEDEKPQKEGGMGEIAQPRTGTVLSLIDAASRLVQPWRPITEAADGGNGPCRKSPAHDSATGRQLPKKNDKNQEVGKNGVFWSLLRIERTLQAHAAGMTRRFMRSSSSSSSSARDVAVGQTPRTSAFATYYNMPPSLRRPDVFASDGSSGDLGHKLCASQNNASAGETRSVRGAEAASRPSDNRPARDPADGGCRISPETNVVTAVPLPAVARMSGLCGACAGVARGLRERIGELEALLRASSARSGQRR
ncbi:unnamed protein product, partial [Scytosiphon promiscuus]